jgi:hypothetical protein
MSQGDLEKFDVPVQGRMPRHFLSASAFEKWREAETAFSFRVLNNRQDGNSSRPPQQGHGKPRVAPSVVITRWNRMTIPPHCALLDTTRDAP